MQSSLSRAATGAATVALVMLLAISPTSRSAQGSPLRFNDDDAKTEVPGDGDKWLNFDPLYFMDYAPVGDDDLDEGENQQQPTHSGDDAMPPIGNWSQEARSSRVALFVEYLAGLLRDLRAPNSSLSVMEALELSSARAADQRLCADKFFRHFFGISSCRSASDSDDDGDDALTAEEDASMPVDGRRSTALRSSAVNLFDSLLEDDLDDSDDQLFEDR